MARWAQGQLLPSVGRPLPGRRCEALTPRTNKTLGEEPREGAAGHLSQPRWVTWEGRRGQEQGRGADVLEAPPHQVRSSQQGALGAGARPGVGLATGQKEDPPPAPGLGPPSHSPRYLSVLGAPLLPRRGVGPRPTPRRANADPLRFHVGSRWGALLGPLDLMSVVRGTRCPAGSRAVP